MAVGQLDRSVMVREERWRTLLAYVWKIVTLVDPAGLITYASPSVKR